jgi:hypothetical protein
MNYSQLKIMALKNHYILITVLSVRNLRSTWLGGSSMFHMNLAGVVGASTSHIPSIKAVTGPAGGA